MEGWISVLVLASLALVQALPLSATIEHKNVKRSAEAVLIGNHQNHERVKKSGPPHFPQEEEEGDSSEAVTAGPEHDSKHDTTRDESAKVSVETNAASEEPNIDDKNESESHEGHGSHESSADDEESHESSKVSSEDTKEESETKEESGTKEESTSPSETEAAELAELEEELPRLTQKERNEIDQLLSELNLPPSSPLYRDFKRSNQRVSRWRSTRRRRAHASALESSMSMKPRSIRSKRETWYPMVVQSKRDDTEGDYPEYVDYGGYGNGITEPAVQYYPDNEDYNGGGEGGRGGGGGGYDVPMTEEDADELLKEIAMEMAEEEAETEAEDAYPIELGRGDEYMTPDKRQYLSFKRSGTFYPYQEMEQSPWAAAIREDAEKRNIQDQYDRLYRLASALRGERR